MYHNREALRRAAREVQRYRNSNINGRLPLNRSIQGMDLSWGKLNEVDHGTLDKYPLRFLDVSHNSLATVPNAVLECRLLQTLNVSHNDLVSLPDVLPAAVRDLNAAHNSLTSLPTNWPATIATLNVSHNPNLATLLSLPASVKYLDISHTAVAALPRCYLRLHELKANNTPLQEVPVELCHDLRTLDIRDTAVTALPPELAQCTRLRAINITGSTVTIPDCVLAMSSLLEITYDGVQPVLEAALVSARSKRDTAASTDGLSAKLTKWGGEPWCMPPDWSNVQVASVLEWLRRLANTADYKQVKSEMRAAAVAMLRTVVDDAEFRTTFFAQVDANLERCGDRAAMAFNEIYSYWRLHQLARDTDVVNKNEIVGVLVSAAKTNTLRALVMQQATGMESVETYLWAETQLRDQLGLLTFTRTMKFGMLGARLDIPLLKAQVLEQYPSVLFDMLENGVYAVEQLEFPMQLPDAEEQAFYARLEEVDGTTSSQAYMQAVSAIQADRAAALLAARMEWLRRFQVL